MVLEGRSSQEYPVNVGVPQYSILGSTLLLLCINIFNGLNINDAICNIAISADDTTLYSKSDQASDMRNLLTLLLTYEILLAGLEILRNIIGWGRKWLVDFSVGKIQIVSFDLSNNCSIIIIKMVFSDIYILKCWVCLSVLNWIGALNIDSITISDSKKN